MTTPSAELRVKVSDQDNDGRPDVQVSVVFENAPFVGSYTLTGPVLNLPVDQAKAFVQHIAGAALGSAITGLGGAGAALVAQVAHLPHP